MDLLIYCLGTDEEVSKTIKAQLQKLISVTSVLDVTPGTEWKSKIKEMLLKAESVLVLLSRQSYQSDCFLTTLEWFRETEEGKALLDNKKIFLLRIHSVLWKGIAIWEKMIPLISENAIGGGGR